MPMFLLQISFNSALNLPLIGAVLVCFLAGIVGTFSFLRKQSLIGDVVSHAALPGVAAAFLFSGVKNPILFWLGATIAGFFAVWIIDIAERMTKLKPDVLQAITLGVFFGLGIMLLTFIQHREMGAQSGLDSFLFGNAAAINRNDVYVLSVVFLINVSMVYFFYRGFKIISFDAHLAHNLGLPVIRLRLLLTFITVSTIAVGIQMVGVILMAALMITPASGARFITKKIPVILILSGFFAAFSGVFGVMLSSQISGLPTGPSIVIILTLITVLAILFGKEKGIWMRYQLQRKNISKIRRENILKLLYKLTQEGTQPVSWNTFNEHKNQSSDADGWSKEMKNLQKSQLLTIVNQEIVLTDPGNLAAKEIVRKHRLWELYLSTYFSLKDDHLHDDAEGIEHVITPEIENHLMTLLDRPEYDPHQSKIPY